MDVDRQCEVANWRPVAVDSPRHCRFRHRGGTSLDGRDGLPQQPDPSTAKSPELCLSRLFGSKLRRRESYRYLGADRRLRVSAIARSMPLSGDQTSSR